MRVGSASEHNHGSCVPHHRSHAYSFRVEGPQQHPMWSDWNGRTRPVKGIGVAVLISWLRGTRLLLTALGRSNPCVRFAVVWRCWPPKNQRCCRITQQSPRKRAIAARIIVLLPVTLLSSARQVPSKLAHRRLSSHLRAFLCAASASLNAESTPTSTLRARRALSARTFARQRVPRSADTRLSGSIGGLK
jgi:hypothetical protein